MGWIWTDGDEEGKVRGCFVQKAMEGLSPKASDGWRVHVFRDESVK